MKYFLFFLFLGTSLSAQNLPTWSINFKPKVATHFPELQSYAIGQYKDWWILIGGRKDGLHKRQSSVAFDSLSRNHHIYLYHPQKDQLITHDISYLPAAVREQFYSSNLLSCQRDQQLFLVGGYGYSSVSKDFVTHDRLTVLELDKAVKNILDSKPIDSTCFHSTQSSDFARTGGKLLLFDHHFLMVGGHNFIGAYNPQGMPSYEQIYTCTIKEFDYISATKKYQQLYSIEDTNLLHRRDLNAVVKKENNGDRLIVFSGVFRKDRNFPFENIFEYKNKLLYPVSNFNQKLCQYHTAVVNLEDKKKNDFYSIFLGGLASNYFQGDSLFYDTDVPFVNHASMVYRQATGEYSEYISNTSLPSQLGTAAEFIPSDNLANINPNMAGNNAVSLGYRVGGIQSKSRNVFWSDEDSASMASSQIIEVFLDQKNNNWKPFARSNSKYNIEIFPDEDYTYFKFSWQHIANEKVLIEVFSP